MDRLFHFAISGTECLRDLLRVTHSKSNSGGVLNLLMCTGSASLKSYYNIYLLGRGQCYCGAISIATAATLLFIKRKQFPPNLGDSDHGNNVSFPGNHRILVAMVICIRAVLCSRMHYRFIMKILKSTKWEG